MSIIDSMVEAFRTKDTIFFKEDNELNEKYNALNKLFNEYPQNKDILNELYLVKKGLDGENEIAYQLKKANIGMYVLRDVKVNYNDLKAQIDFIVITPVFTYYIECKNLTGNITVNEKGDFIKEFNVNGRKVKNGIYSPLRQVEAQREVIRKIWEERTGKITKMFAAKHFEYYRRVLVVAANKDTILNTSKAPQDIKYKVLRADSLIRQIKYDLEHRNKDDYFASKKEMELTAKSYMSILVNDNIDYYGYYKRKFIKDNLIENKKLETELIEFRKSKSIKMNIPAFYVFTNEELDKLIKLKPKTINELKESNILSAIKVKTHGEDIINIIKNKNI